ncbi:hypothetical protein HZS_6967, partial [Henneguya salminicola]
MLFFFNLELCSLYVILDCQSKSSSPSIYKLISKSESELKEMINDFKHFSSASTQLALLNEKNLSQKSVMSSEGTDMKFIMNSVIIGDFNIFDTLFLTKNSDKYFQTLKESTYPIRRAFSKPTGSSIIEKRNKIN